MKRISAIIIITVFILSLGGCFFPYRANSELQPSDSAPDASAMQPSNDTISSVQPTSESHQTTQIVINETTDSKEGTFYLGQSGKEVRKILNDMQVFIKNDIDISIYTDEFGFEFDEQDVLTRIAVLADSNTPTVSGLRFGDSYEDMIELYGTGYSEETLSSDASKYEYKIGGHYFYVRIYNGGVNLWGISKNNENEYTYDNSINVDDVHGNNYYDFLLVETYIKSRIRAINQNNFDSIVEYLDEDSDIYQSEKQYINDCTSQGIQHKLLNFTHEDIKEVSANLYDLVYSFKFEEISLDNTKTKKEMRQVFTVFDDGDTLKIIDINDFSDPWIGDYSFSEQNVSYRFTINKSYGNYRATFYIDRYNIEQQFKTIIVGDENSIDIIFNFYSSETTINPYEKGDVLLTLKKENDEIITYWGKMQPMLSSNCESGSVYFIKVVLKYRLFMSASAPK